MFTKGKFESTQMQNLCTFCYQHNLKQQFVFTISHIVSLHWRNKDNFQNLISKNSFSLYDWTEIFILAYTNITFSLYTYYNLVEFSAILSGYDHFSRERRGKGIDILLLVFSGRSRDHFLHARACYMMKQNSPNCLLCPNESFPSKGFYLMHMHSKHNIEVDAMLCISCGISTSIFEYLPRHQIKCFQVLF